MNLPENREGTLSTSSHETDITLTPKPTVKLKTRQPQTSIHCELQREESSQRANRVQQYFTRIMTQ